MTVLPPVGIDAATMVQVDDENALFVAMLRRWQTNAANLAWPDLTLDEDDQITVGFMGDIGDPDFVAQVMVHRGGELVRHAAFSGWDGVSFMLRWVDRAVE